MDTLVQTEQEVKPGEVEVQAGESTEAVDTAATEEGTGFSIEDIASDVKPATDEEVLGVSDRAQERLNSKISSAIPVSTQD